MFIAISCYNKDNLKSQIKSLYNESNKYFIHWNFRNTLKNPFEYFRLKKEIMNEYNNVIIKTRYKVFWGGYSIIKSILYSQKFFMKSNENIFIHIDNKTINVKNINIIENNIKKFINKGYNFFDFNMIACKKINHIPPTTKTSTGEMYYDFFTKRNWYKRTSKKNSIFYKLNFFIIKAFLIIFDKQFWLKFLKTFNLKESLTFFNNYYFSNNEIMYVEGLMNKKMKKKEKKFSEKIEFKSHCINGSFVCLTKNEILKLNYKYSKNKFIKKFNKYCKNKYIPDDFYFSTLYWNVIGKNISKSADIMYFYDINTIQDFIFAKNNIFSENTLFVKRVDSNIMMKINNLI